MKTLNAYTLADLKRVYTTLHSHLQNDPDLMDSVLLEDLQTLLITQARLAGIDTTDHQAWSQWLRQA